MNNNINRLLQIEEEIANSYTYLAELEYNNEKNSISFDTSKNALKNSLKEEKEIFNILNEKELLALNDNTFLTQELKNYKSDYNIKNRINQKIMFLIAEQETHNLEDKIVIDAISSESKDTFLSFLDEEIDKHNNKEKEFLINEKYKFIYGLEDNDETRLLERNFSTSKSLYLYSQMYAQANQTNSKLYDIYKFSIALGMLKEVNEKLDADRACLNGPYKYVVLSQIRTNMLLLDREKYDELLEIINSSNSLPLLLNYLFQGNFIKVLEKDKERHKVLSLIPNKLHE